MNLKKELTLSDFSITVAPPSNRLASLSVNIYGDGRFNMNGKLAEKLGSQKVSIRFTEDCRHLCLLENGDISFPKSGSRKIPELSDLLNKKGITFPAHYEVSFNSNEKFWLGVYCENPMKRLSEKVRSTRKRSSS